MTKPMEHMLMDCEAVRRAWLQCKADQPNDCTGRRPCGNLFNAYLKHCAEDKKTYALKKLTKKP